MRKILIAIAAVACLYPGAPAFAGDTAAPGARRSADAIRAGEKDERTSEAWRDAKRHMDAKRHDDTRRRLEAKRQAYVHYYGKGVREARRAKVELEHADPSLTRLFDTSPGYALFATVDGDQAGLGDARATGVLFEGGHATGRATLTEAAVGLSPGRQPYTEVVFFETEKALADFKRGRLTMAAQASAVALTPGASARARHVDGVSVFTLARGGVMAIASVAGQSFGYRAFPYPVAIGSP